MADGGEVVDGMVGFVSGVVDETVDVLHEAATVVGGAAAGVVRDTASAVVKPVAAAGRWMSSPRENGGKFAAATAMGIAGATWYYAPKAIGAAAGAAVSKPVAIGAVVAVGGAATAGAAYKGYQAYKTAAEDRRKFALHGELREARAANREVRSATREVKAYGKREKAATRKIERAEAKLVEFANRHGAEAVSYGKLPPKTKVELSKTRRGRRQTARRTANRAVLDVVARHGPDAAARHEAARERADRARTDMLKLPPLDLPRGRRARRQLGLGKSK